MSEPQFVDGKVVGDLDKGVFFQRIYTKHIYRRFNAKGIDKRLHQALRGKCRLWRLEFEDTKQVIEIAYDRIALSGFEFNPGGGIPAQIMVKLQYFDELKPVSQRRMI